MLMAPSGCQCLGDSRRSCSSPKRRLSFSFIARVGFSSHAPLDGPHHEETPRSRCLILPRCIFFPFLSSPFSFRRVSSHPISVPPLTELHSYYPLTSLRFLATLSLVLPISPHLASASHIRLCFRPAPPLSPRAGRPRPRRLCSPAAATLLPSLVLSLAAMTHLH